MYRTKILSFAFVEKKREYCNIYRIFKAKYSMNERRIKKKKNQIFRKVYLRILKSSAKEKRIFVRECYFLLRSIPQKKKKNQQMSDPLKI